MASERAPKGTAAGPTHTAVHVHMEEAVDAAGCEVPRARGSSSQERAGKI